MPPDGKASPSHIGPVLQSTLQLNSESNMKTLSDDDDLSENISTSTEKRLQSTYQVIRSSTTTDVNVIAERNYELLKLFLGLNLVLLGTKIL